MKAGEFVRRIQKLGRDRGTPVLFDPRGGKGSHGVLYLGDRRTIVKDRKKELPKGLLHSMLRHPGLTLDDIR